MAPTPLQLLTSPAFVLTAAALLLIALTVRLLTILTPRPAPIARRTIGTPTRLLVVLGSGGHTAEMLSALRDLDPQKYTHRTYVVSSGDTFSAQKAAEFERGLEEQALKDDGEAKSTTGASAYDIATVPRARRVHQSLLSTPWSAARCLWACFGVLHTPPPSAPGPIQDCDLPDLILTNGPATAVIVVLAALILRFFDIRRANSRGKMRTIYMESWARVTTLSLSGKLLLYVLKVDRVLVQWEQLKGIGGRAEFLGVLV